MEWAWESVGVTERILKQAGRVSPCFRIREELHFHHPKIVTRRLGPMLLSRGGSYGVLGQLLTFAHRSWSHQPYGIYDEKMNHAKEHTLSQENYI